LETRGARKISEATVSNSCRVSVRTDKCERATNARESVSGPGELLQSNPPNGRGKRKKSSEHLT
jgi:hypothetical protein